MALTTWLSNPDDPGRQRRDDADTGEMIAEVYPLPAGDWQWVVWADKGEGDTIASGQARSEPEAKACVLEALGG